MDKVIQHNGAKITVRRGNVRSRLQQGKIYNKLGLADTVSEDDFLEINLFARYVIQVTIEGDCDIAMPSVGADEKELREAMEAFMTSSDPIYNEIVDAIYEVDADDYNDPELRAETDPKA